MCARQVFHCWTTPPALHDFSYRLLNCLFSTDKYAQTKSCFPSKSSLWPWWVSLLHVSTSYCKYLAHCINSRHFWSKLIHVKHSNNHWDCRVWTCRGSYQNLGNNVSFRTALLAGVERVPQNSSVMWARAFRSTEKESRGEREHKGGEGDQGHPDQRERSDRPTSPWDTQLEAWLCVSERTHLNWSNFQPKAYGDSDSGLGWRDGPVVRCTWCFFRRIWSKLSY